VTFLSYLFANSIWLYTATFELRKRLHTTLTKQQQMRAVHVETGVLLMLTNEEDKE